MKVLDLHCAQGHVFEGWFASEDDFVSQCSRLLVQCPVCGTPEVVKKLSAPRLNLATKRSGTQEIVQPGSVAEPGAAAGSSLVAGVDAPSLQAAWMALARQIVAQTSDVGNRFAEEARKMHYQEIESRAIRGTASMEETRSLLDEGIEVMPLLLPDAAKETLQ